MAVAAAAEAEAEGVVAAAAAERCDRCGLGWRSELAAGILANLDQVDLVEIIADDHFSAGRADLRALRTLAAQVPVTLHGVTMGLASTVSVDTRRLDRMARLAEHPQRAVPTVEEITGRPGTTFAEWAVKHAGTFR